MNDDDRSPAWDAPWTPSDGDPGPSPVVAALAAARPDGPVDTDLIERAWRVAARAHDGQRRKTGQPYIVHPVAVAVTCAELALDDATVVAALLHDTVEDTAVTVDDVARLFGGEVAGLVDGVTKLDAVDGQAAKAKTVQKVIVGTVRDIRTLLLKLADRLHNMRTLAVFGDDARGRAKRARIARETMDVYVPLAARLGVWELKSQLEDLAFRHLDPAGYAATAAAVARTAPQSAAATARFVSDLNAALLVAGLDVDLQSRTKTLWSAYNKAQARGCAVSDLHDLSGVRVVCRTVADCYTALGVLHRTWRPVPGTFDDYIATPKFNLYQSLHSTVMGPSGAPIEVQIRTGEMHARAEHGLAAHFAYKASDDAPAWVGALADQAADADDPVEWLAALKADLVRDELFVFTRDGDLLHLPDGATPIDVAYAIHTDVGFRCVGAKVNGRQRPLRSPLRSGDQVEIVTDDESPGPRADWLDVVATPRARAEISRAVRRRRRTADRDAAAREIRLVAAEQGLAGRVADDDALDRVAADLGLDSRDRLLDRVASGGLGPGAVVAQLVASQDPARRRTVTVAAVDRTGLLADVARVFADHGVALLAVHTGTAASGHATMTLTTAGDLGLDDAVADLPRVAGVADVSVSDLSG